jgi:hypothetical protein
VSNGVENERANPGEPEGATVLLEQAEPFDMAALRGCRKDPPLSRAALGMPAGFERGPNAGRHGVRRLCAIENRQRIMNRL